MKNSKILSAIIIIAITTCTILTFAHRLEAKPASACTDSCTATKNIAMNICQHVAPANKIACVAKAIKNYNTCINNCQ